MRRRLLAVGLMAGLFVGAAFAQAPSGGPGPSHAPQPGPVIDTKPDPRFNPPKAEPPVPIQISGSSNVPCYSYARFDAVGTLNSAGWMCFPDRTTGASVISTDTFNGGTTFIVSGSPGTYDIGLFAATPSGIVTKQTQFTINPPLQPPTPVQPPVPQPQPTPVNPPGPAPTPTPVSGKFWAMGVYDTSKPLPSSYSDGTIGPTIAGEGGTWLKYDVNDPSVSATNWIAAAKQLGGPALVIVNSDGSIYSAAALPADAASIVAAIKTAKGKR